MAAEGEPCDCCGADTSKGNWDGIYTCCNDCAWCQSLGLCVKPGTDEEICCHGACLKRKAAKREAKDG